MKIVFKLCLLLFSLFLTVSFSYADDTAVVATEKEQLQKIDKAMSTPVATLNTFVAAMEQVIDGNKQQMEQAVSTMDLTDVSSFIRKDRGTQLAYTLYYVIKEGKKPNLKKASSPKTDEYIFVSYPQGDVAVAKQLDGHWLFSKNTIETLPKIQQALLALAEGSNKVAKGVKVPFHVTFRAKLPSFLTKGFLLEYWQWIGLLVIVLFGIIADKILAWILARNISSWQRKNPIFEDLDNDVLRPLGLMAMALIWWFGLEILGLPDVALVILSVAVKLLVSLSGVWSAFRLVDILESYLRKKAQGTVNKFDDMLVPMISKTLKVFVLVVAVVFIADNLNVDVSSLLAGLGIGGLAFALAAKDLLGNFFGSLTVVTDKPFQIGDWVIIDGVEGSVEQVGFRSTRIRTFYNSLVTLPNAVLTTSMIDNMGARRYRRMKTMLGLTYDTSPEKIESFCEGIRQMIRLHPYMRKDYYQVYFNEYGPSSLNILVYVFWATPDWNMELRERHRFLLDILRLAKQLEVEFAFPTQTLYLKQDEASPNPPSKFKPSMTEQDAHKLGQKEAEAIFDTTLGKGVIPGPVKFP